MRYIIVSIFWGVWGYGELFYYLTKEEEKGEKSERGVARKSEGKTVHVQLREEMEN